MQNTKASTRAAGLYSPGRRWIMWQLGSKVSRSVADKKLHCTMTSRANLEWDTWQSKPDTWLSLGVGSLRINKKKKKEIKKENIIPQLLCQQTILWWIWWMMCVQTSQITVCAQWQSRRPDCCWRLPLSEWKYCGGAQTMWLDGKWEMNFSGQRANSRVGF